MLAGDEIESVKEVFIYYSMLHNERGADWLSSA